MRCWPSVPSRIATQWWVRVPEVQIVGRCARKCASHLSRADIKASSLGRLGGSVCRCFISARRKWEICKAKCADTYILTDVARPLPKKVVTSHSLAGPGHAPLGTQFSRHSGKVTEHPTSPEAWGPRTLIILMRVNIQGRGQGTLSRKSGPLCHLGV